MHVDEFGNGALQREKVSSRGEMKGFAMSRLHDSDVWESHFLRVRHDSGFS